MLNIFFTFDVDNDDEGAPMPPTIVPKRQTRVLCIDDNVEMLECLKSFLETFGYSVQITTSGIEAIELAARWNADTVIVNYDMPEMNGQQVAREIKRIRSHVAIILLSGDVDIPGETLKTVDAFVDKNQVASQLLPTISDLAYRMPAPPQIVE
jgi:CheY-like chemotaxis protein